MLLVVSFDEVLNLVKSNLSIRKKYFFPYAMAFGILSKKTLPTLMS